MLADVFSRIFRSRPRTIILLTVLGLMSSSQAFGADGSNRIAARALGGEGVEAYSAGNYEEASKKLESAYELIQAPTIALWSARALAKLGKLVEASERFLEATRLPVESGGDQSVQQKAQKEAAAERENLAPRIPTLTIMVEAETDEPITLSINGKAVDSAFLGRPRPSNPGTLEVVAQRGGVSATQTVVLAEGESKSLTLSFLIDGSKPAVVAAAAVAPGDKKSEAVSESSGDPANDAGTGSRQMWRTVGWAGVGVGAAGIVLGSVTGVMAISTQNDLGCTVCTDPGQEDDVNKLGVLRTTSTVGFVAGGVLAAAGVMILLVGPSSVKKSASITPYLSASSAGFMGTF